MVHGGNNAILYQCSKHAAQSFTNNLRVELRPFHIAVASVNPTFHATPLVDSIEELTQQQIDQLPQHIRDQYGVGT